MTVPDRSWFEEFVPPRRSPQSEDLPLIQEIVIQERGGNYFDVFLTHPDRRLLTRLTLDECLGFVAMAIVNRRGPRWNTLDHERDWIARYETPAAPRVLEPWEKQLPERCTA